MDKDYERALALLFFLKCSYFKTTKARLTQQPARSKAAETKEEERTNRFEAEKEGKDKNQISKVNFFAVRLATSKYWMGWINY